ncbi:MAG TPA: TMEM14 family protein [Candidatus Saccharimonadales bacterium]|nr:TMEM14 family protein [Candidatus Saccharimonadales bacterium]
MVLTPTLIVLWIYIVLLVAGGLMGFLKAGSKISLITASLFALLLALCALDIIRPFYIAKILVAALALIFGVRYSKGRKFMPSGLMALLSFVVFVLLLVLH